MLDAASMGVRQSPGVDWRKIRIVGWLFGLIQKEGGPFVRSSSSDARDLWNLIFSSIYERILPTRLKMSRASVRFAFLL
jgi:hypothetical protein